VIIVYVERAAAGVGAALEEATRYALAPAEGEAATGALLHLRVAADRASWLRLEQDEQHEHTARRSKSGRARTLAVRTTLSFAGMVDGTSGIERCSEGRYVTAPE
jgi:hypothetical protein